jgi:hypothetical protein
MSVHQNSKIQVRRGLKENLPQLAGGEFGWAIDTQQLYIGTGTLAEGAPFEGDVLINSGGGGSSYTPFGEIPTGTINGTNRVFTLSVTPSLVNVWLNFPLIPNVGYTIVGNTITYANAPDIGDSIYANGLY